MANTHAFLLWGAGAALANNQFNSLNGSSQYQNTTESWYQTVLGKGVTFTKFAVYWHVILAGGGNLNFRKNGANGNQTLVGGVADGIVQDVTHTDAIAANSQLNQKVTSTANSGTFQHVAFDFNGNKSTLPYVASFNPRQGGGPAAYLAPGGAILINVATIALANVPVTVGFTASQLLFSSDTSQNVSNQFIQLYNCLLYTSPSPRDLSTSRMPSSG